MPQYPRHITGVLLVILSAIVFSTAGIFAKGVQTDAWGIIFWRGLAGAGFTFAYMALRGTLTSEIKAFRGAALLATLLMASGTAAFIPAFKLTSVANVALIYGAAPFISAALAWVFINEHPGKYIIGASIAALIGVAIIVGGSLQGGGLAGNMLALWMTFMMACTIVLYRRWPETTAALPAAASSLVLLPVALAFGEPLNAASNELPILTLFGLVFALASVTLFEGARRLPAPETALLSALEMPFAPLWAWLVLSQAPATATLIGGTVIIVSVVSSQIRA